MSRIEIKSEYIQIKPRKYENNCFSKKISVKLLINKSFSVTENHWRDK